MGLPPVKVSVQAAQEDSQVKGVAAAPAAGKIERGDSSPLFNLPGTENYFITLPHPTLQSSSLCLEKLLLNKGEDHQGKEYSRNHR